MPYFQLCMQKSMCHAAGKTSSEGEEKKRPGRGRLGLVQEWEVAGPDLREARAPGCPSSHQQMNKQE